MSTHPRSARPLFRKRRSLALSAAAIAVAGATLAPVAAGAAAVPTAGTRAFDAASTVTVAADLRSGAADAAAQVSVDRTPVVARNAKRPAPKMTVFQYAAAINRAKFIQILAFAAAVEAAKQAAAVNPVWDRLAQCESGGNWAINTGAFDGGLQFLPSTWRAQGGGQFAPYAYQATRLQQIAVAERLLAATGGSYRASWPGCSRHLGLG